MATSTTFQGKPKPFGKPGHYYESNRHALQAKGIKTGSNIAETPPLVELGLTQPEPADKIAEKQVEVEPTASQEVTYEPTTFEVEAEQEPEKSESVIKKIIAGYKAEKKSKSRTFKRKSYEDVGREEELEDEEEPEDFEGGGMKFGKIIADITGDYNSEDLVALSDKELEELAVKFDSSAGGLFGKPSNPYLEELKKRITSREMVRFEKEKLNARLEAPRKQIRQEIAEIRKKALSGDKGDIFDRIWGM